MRATLNGYHEVVVVEVGRLSSCVRYRTQEGDVARRWVRNLELEPEPCGACLGRGCKACEQRGYAPRKSQAVLQLGRSLGGLALRALDRLRRDRHVLDAAAVEQEHIAAGKCPNCLLELHEGECA